MLPVFLLIWMIGLVKEPRRMVFFRMITIAWMRVFFFLTFCRLKITGKEHFKRGQNYIIISNHNSMMDVAILTPFIPGANKTIAKIEMARTPLFGLIYKRGAVLVDRKNKASRGESYNKMKAVLEMGIHMCIYPEGTRNKTSEPLKDFHDGAFRLAIDTRKPIMPGILFNTKKVMPSDKTFFLWPGPMELRFLAPRIIKEGDTAEGLKRELFERMKEAYKS